MTMKKNAYFDLLNANHSLNKTRLALFNPFTLKLREWFTEGKESVVLCAWKTMPPGKSLPSERGRLVIVSLCVYTWFTRRRRIIHLADVAHVYESRSRARARSRKITIFLSQSFLHMRLLPGAQVLRILIFSSTLCCAHTRTTKRPTVGATWSSLPGDRRGSKHGSGPVLVVSWEKIPGLVTHLFFFFYNTLKRYIELLCKKKNRLGDLLLAPQITRGKKGGGHWQKLCAHAVFSTTRWSLRCCSWPDLVKQLFRPYRRIQKYTQQLTQIALLFFSLPSWITSEH